jgi:uncharacterized protein YfaS (alpha-2-macroglobulin family)
MKQNLRFSFFSLLIIIMAGGCVNNPALKTTLTTVAVPTKPSVPSSIPAETNLPSPLVIQYSPQNGQEVQAGEPVELTFDQPMDRASVENAFSVQNSQSEPVSGKITWIDDTHLQFKADSGWPEAAYFEIRVSDTAKGQNGQTLTREFSSQFKTIAPLMVSQVFPAENTEDVDTGSSITVLFNRPVIALQTKEDQTKLPQPIHISPELKGKGNWVNSTIYTFQPDEALSSNTRYTVQVDKGLAEVSGDTQLALKQAYAWEFSTRKSAVTALAVDGSKVDLSAVSVVPNVSLLPKIIVQFTQPMDQAATSRAAALLIAEGKPVPIRTEWSKDGLTLTITPKQILSIAKTYTLRIQDTAKAKDGGEIDKALSCDLQTISAPSIASTYPADGSKDIPNLYFTIQFGTSMNSKTIQQRVIFSPASGEKVQMYYNDSSQEAYFYGLEPSTDYTVKILAGMQDLFGNLINSPMEIHFSTGQTAAAANFNMPMDTIFRGNAPQEFYIDSTNVKNLKFQIYRINADALAGNQDISKLVLSDSNRVADFDFHPKSTLDKNTLENVKIQTADGKPLPAGAYFLSMDSDEVSKYEGQKYVDYRFMMVTDVFLVFKTGQTDALVWAIDADSGQPVSGLSLDLKTMDQYSQTSTIASGTTDKDGLVHFTMDSAFSELFVTSAESSPFTFGDGWWNQQFSLEDFGYQNEYSSKEFNTTAYLYTDRPLYRPGQPVYFKGIMRQDNDLEYLIPSQKEVEVVVNSYDQEVFKKTYPLSASGTFSGEFTLDDEAALGNYVLTVRKPYATTGEYYNTLNFNVAAYRKPDFKVTLSSDKSDLLNGGAFTASLEADYYAGGALSNAKVDWTLTADPYLFTPPEKYSAFSFMSTAEDDNWYSYRPSYEGSRQLAQGSATTDETGKAEMKVPVKVVDSKASQVLTFETTVTGLSGNPVSERIKVNAHTSELITGIRALQYVAQAGKEQTFEVVVLDWNGQPVANQLVNVVINERKWYSVQKEDAQKVLRWETNVKDIPVAHINAKTDENGLARGVYTPENGGTFQAVVSAYDKGRHISQASAYQWVSGSNYVAWRQSNDRSFQLVADKAQYNPGETAEVLIASPYQGEAYALVTVERAKIRKTEVIKLTSNSTLYHLPITEDMGPAVYLAVTVVKGMDDTNPYPTYKTSIVRLNVSTQSKRVSIEITPDKKQASPGEKVQLTILTKDSQSKPISAEVSLALVDLSSLALSDPNSDPIADFFYSLRGLQIHTILSHDLNIDVYNLQLNEIVTGEKSGGGGGENKGGDIPGVMGIRKNFPDTAYWNATVQTDEQGRAAVTVTLPGNLTTWRVDARAVTADTLVGQNTADILSNKPLMVQPITPRFFINGDKSQVSALVTNNTNADLPVTASLEAGGLAVADAQPREIQVKAGQQQLVTWKVTIPDQSSRVDLTFSVKGGNYTDASLPPLGTLDNQGLPVYSYEVPETVGTSGILQGSGTRVEGIRLPNLNGSITGNMRIEIEPSLVNGLEKGVDFLDSTSYESMDVTVSQFLAAIALKKALAVEGNQTSTAQQQVDEILNKSLQRIYTRQNADGGWGWWNETQSDSVTSAYVLIGLEKLQENDISVEQDVIKRGVDYLGLEIGNIRENKNIPLDSRMNRQAFLLYAITQNHTSNIYTTSLLYQDRANLSFFGRAMLLRAMDLQNHKDPRIQTLMADLVSSAALSSSGASWEEKTHDWWNWNTDTRTTAIVLDTLIQLDPQNPLIASSVRWLMNHRTQGCWATTQETAWSLMALSDWMVMSKELQADYAYTISLNDKSLADGKVDSTNISETKSIEVELSELMADQTNKLTFTRGAGNGSLYYTTYLTVNLPVADIQPLDQGFTISRKYYNPADMTHGVTTAKTGDLLITELTIVVPQSLHYVTIEDPLPAGMEAVDSTLKTSPQGINDQLYDWKSFTDQGWGWWYFTHVEQRDEKIALFADWLPAGTYIYHYYVRATTPGQYQVIPPHGQEVYFPDVYSRGSGSEFTIQ